MNQKFPGCDDPFVWVDEVCRCLRDLAPIMHPAVASSTGLDLVQSGDYVGMVPREAAARFLALQAQRGDLAS